jgi:predicted ArsR family transcriptional regulator
VSELEWNLESAELAYDTIARYVEHTQISALLIAYLANALGEERLRTLVQEQQWQLYQASRHQLGEAREAVDKLTALIDRMRTIERGE